MDVWGGVSEDDLPLAQESSEACPTKIVDKGKFFIKTGNDGKDYKYPAWMMDDMKNREKNRSRTFVGIAEAMAEQWGRL